MFGEPLKPSTKNLLTLSLLIATLSVAAYLSYYVIGYVLPFLISFILSLCALPIARLLRKTRLPNFGCALIALLVVLGIIITLIILVSRYALDEGQRFVMRLPEMVQGVVRTLDDFLVQLDTRFTWFTPEMREDLTRSLSSLSNFTAPMQNILSRVYFTVTSLPQVIIFLAFTIISAFLMTYENEAISAGFKRQFPGRWVDTFVNVVGKMFKALFGYIRAQLILMTITFVLLFIGFSLLRADYVLLLAVLIAIADALPVVGTGLFLNTWAVFSLISGDFARAGGLLVLYIVCLSTRQLLEPKVLSSQIGQHPLITMLSMYVGMRLFGLGGLIVGPISGLICRSLYSSPTGGRSVKEIIEKGFPSFVEEGGDVG